MKKRHGHQPGQEGLHAVRLSCFTPIQNIVAQRSGVSHPRPFVSSLDVKTLSDPPANGGAGHDDTTPRPLHRALFGRVLAVN